MLYPEAIMQYFANKLARDYPAVGQSAIAAWRHLPQSLSEVSDCLLSPGQSIFTIGSCFARNIEEALDGRGVVLPTRSFAAPQSEFYARSNGLLNEYNPGAISQRILHTLEQRALSNETLVAERDGYADLSLPGGSPVSLERALERRAEIADVYKQLPSADIVIMTLGFVECWYDEETDLYLNQPPPHAFAKKHETRFSFRRLDVDQCMALLQPAMSALADIGKKVVLTVSPVPIQSTFTKSDCVVANEFSKSVLRICAERLSNSPAVDYFPSYEIVRSAGVAAYETDQTHVRDAMVREVVGYMIETYTQSGVAA